MGRGLEDNDALTQFEATGIGCVLRVWGDVFEIDNLLSRVSITPCHVQWKGRPRFGPQSKVAEYTGFNVSTSDASECDLPTQIKDTVAYLQSHGEDLACIMSFPGVTGAVLDFSIERQDVVVQNDYLPPELLLTAGKLRIGINLSHYPLRDVAETKDLS